MELAISKYFQLVDLQDYLIKRDLKYFLLKFLIKRNQLYFLINLNTTQSEARL